jgi:hypothetical protein
VRLSKHKKKNLAEELASMNDFKDCGTASKKAYPTQARKVSPMLKLRLD